MRWRVGVWSGVGVAVATAAGLAVFWKIKGLEQAGWLAGVLSAFAALASLAIFLYDRSPSRPGPQPPPESAPDTGTVNTFQDATSTGPVVMGRDISGPVTSGSTPPPPSPRPAGAQAAPPPVAATGEGTVSNTLTGGFIQGPVVMGRDISGPVTSPPSASLPPQPGDRQQPQQEPDRAEPAHGERGGDRSGPGEPHHLEDER